MRLTQTPGPMTKHILRAIYVFALLAPFQTIAQSPVVCPISAGADQTICAPNCANLTGTFVPTNQTTTYTTSVIPYTPDPFNVGTTIILSDDQWSGVIPLPFTFCFYGTQYTQCVIGSNGLISFNLGQAGGYCQWPINAPVPSTADPMNSIMGPWHDLYPPGGGQIRYITYGTAPCRRFVVSWDQLPMYSCTTTLCTQQLVLYETTNIIDNFIQTKALCPGWNAGAAIQAVHNAAGSNAVVVTGRNYPTQWLANNDANRWTPAGASTSAIAWYQGATLISNNASITVCPTTTTVYTFQSTHTNCNNTTVTVSDQVTVIVSQLITSAGPDVTICQGGCTNLTANALGALSYAWTVLPSGAPVGNSQTISVCPVTTTSYVVTADNGVCTGTDTVVVLVNPMTTASAGANDSVCQGACVILQGSGGMSYSWGPASAITGPTNIANPLACPTVTTQYTLTVTNAGGCTGTDSVIIYVAPQILSVTATPTHVTCFAACNGQVMTNTSGGYSPYAYSWSNSSTTQNLTGLCTGNYTVTVTDQIGCTATESVVITQPTALSAQATSIVAANCGQNDGSVTITVGGGTPFPGNAYTILWPASGNSGFTESNLSAGPVCVYVYDANGCGDTLCVTVPNTPGATVNIIASNNVSCFNACDGWAVADGSGGATPYSYVWNTLPQNQANDTATGLCPGVYIVTMTDANSCQATASITITQPPQLFAVPGTGPTICISQSGGITAIGNGGTPGYNYAWTDGTNNWSTQNITVSPTVTTTYTVIVTDANGCVSAPQPLTVIVNQPLNVQAMPDITVCEFDLVNIAATGTGGNNQLTYTWQPGNLVGQTVQVTASQTTTYTVVVTDNCNTPPDTSFVTVSVNAAPVVSFAATSTTSGCATHCVTFTNNTPSTASVLWMFGNNLGTSALPSPSFCFPLAGSYDVTATVTDNIGCVGTTTLINYVTVWPLPVADFVSTPLDPTMLFNEVTFTDQSFGAPVSWTWNFDENGSVSFLQNPTYEFQDSGTFNVQLMVTNQFGCIDSVTYPVVVLEDYAYYIPNAFTPNGDGLNDKFVPMGTGVNPERFTMYIFDRWGTLVFTTNDMNAGWDGKFSAGICPVGVYVYKIHTTAPDGSRHQYLGHISLLR